MNLKQTNPESVIVKTYEEVFDLVKHFIEHPGQKLTRELAEKKVSELLDRLTTCMCFTDRWESLNHYFREIDAGLYGSDKHYTDGKLSSKVMCLAFSIMEQLKWAGIFPYTTVTYKYVPVAQLGFYDTSLMRSDLVKNASTSDVSSMSSTTS